MDTIDKNIPCGTCGHRADIHGVTGKHKCMELGCMCQWFKFPQVEKAEEAPTAQNLYPNPAFDMSIVNHFFNVDNPVPSVDVANIYHQTNESLKHVHGYPLNMMSEAKDHIETALNGEVRTTNEETGAQKGMKPQRHDLIPGPALDLLATLYGNGAAKYAAHNWRRGYEWSKSYAAAQRHMLLFWEGEDIDPEMQVPHVICAAFHMFALATYMQEHPEMDDRFSTVLKREAENKEM